MYTIPFKIPTLGYEEALAALTKQLRLGIDPVLETVQEMLEALDNPQSHYEVIQIAGTNGKTSTSRYTAAFLQSHGVHTGLYTSPELVEMTERIELQGTPVEKELFAQGVSAALEAGKRVNALRKGLRLEPYSITQFDILTVAALVIFALQELDVAVLEVGMGGRWDATSATNPIITAITGVDFDHTQILGATKEAIAAEKAAIIHAGQSVFLGSGVAEDEDVAAVIFARCAEAGVDSCVVSKNTRIESLVQAHKASAADALHMPSYQHDNINLALHIAEGFLHKPILDTDILSTLSHLQIPGRFEILSKRPYHIIDAAHNPQSVRITMEELADFSVRTSRPLNVLIAMFADKDVASMVRNIVMHLGPQANLYVTQTKHPRCLPAKELAALCEKAGSSPRATFSTVGRAYKELAKNDWLALGTITLAGELKRLAAAANTANPSLVDFISKTHSFSRR